MIFLLHVIVNNKIWHSSNA